MKTFIGILLLVSIAMFAIVGTIEHVNGFAYAMGLLFLGALNVIYMRIWLHKERRSK
jgi:hypothetical protein